jgi:hypothetical protein
MEIGILYPLPRPPHRGITLDEGGNYNYNVVLIMLGEFQYTSSRPLHLGQGPRCCLPARRLSERAAAGVRSEPCKRR